MADTPERIAKVLARAGIASRREAERLIEAGRVAVNGKTIASPALNVTPADRITFDGKPVEPADIPRLWLYHKPEGLVTTAKDEKGRRTVFDALPDTLPRVMSSGRRDIGSEGLLLLTNDGGIKRHLELPSTGWLRKYRVRIHGTPEDSAFSPLRRGLTVDGERFRPMDVALDRQQGANAWVTVGIREGKNREIRRAMEAIGLPVNRLIRISYGPFRLGELKPGEVSEVKGRVLRDQLGLETTPRRREAAKSLRSGRICPILYGKAACLPIWSKIRTGNPTPNATPSPRDPPGRRPRRAPGLHRLGISQTRRRPWSGRQDNANAAGRLFRADRSHALCFRHGVGSLTCPGATAANTAPEAHPGSLHRAGWTRRGARGRAFARTSSSSSPSRSS